MKTQQIVLNSLLSAFSILLALVCRVFMVPGVPFLKFDIADAPIFTATLIFGIPSGFAVLFLVSFIRVIFFSIAGWTGFFLRMISIVVIFFLGIYKKKKKFLVLISIIATFSYILVKAPVSFIFWTYFHGISPDFIRSIMLPIIIPFNLIKTFINIFLSITFKNFLRRMRICGIEE